MNISGVIAVEAASSGFWLATKQQCKCSMAAMIATATMNKIL